MAMIDFPANPSPGDTHMQFGLIWRFDGGAWRSDMDFAEFATAAQGLLAETALQPGAQIPWTDVTGKPATFPPSAHTHMVAQITDFPSLANVATSGQYADLSGLPSLFDGAYASLSGIPATFPPSAHTHGNITLTAGAGLTGGGTLGTNREVAADIATAADLRAGAASKLVDAAGVYAANAPVVSSGSGAFSLNLGAGRVFQRTLTGNSTLANPSNQVAGQGGVIFVIPNANGRTLSYGSDWKHIGGSAPGINTGANRVNVFSYHVRSPGNISLSYLGSE